MKTLPAAMLLLLPVLVPATAGSQSSAQQETLLSIKRFVPSAGHSVPVPLDSLAWLAGCWEGTTGNGRIVSEVWMTPLGGMMLGTARTVRNGRTTGYEYARIEQRADGTVRYVALPSGQRETAFMLVSLAGKKAVFENPNHDFPQRIIYRLVSPDSLAARVESIDPASGGGEDYGYRKANP
jgi:hypothetical protein